MGLSGSPVVPPSLSVRERGTPRPHRESSPPGSAPPAGVGECFSFKSLVVRLPYSLIFCQYWLVFIFKFVVVLVLVVCGGTVFLSMPPS